MRVVIQVGASRDDPVDEAGFDQGYERRHAQSSRRERTGQRHADRNVVAEHACGEELAGFAQTRRVIGEEGAVDEIGRALAPGDSEWVDLPTAKEFRRVVRDMRGTGP